MISSLAKGLFIGAALVLPGLSAGTVILILGFYHQFINDLSALRIKPYLPFLPGVLGGVLSTAYLVGYLLENHYLALTAFLFGMLLASVVAVVNIRPRPSILPWPIFFALGGFYLAWFVICEPARTFTVLPPGGLFHFFLGGTFSSATMLLPGISGSSVLIIMNLYDDVIYAVNQLQWTRLLALLAGFSLGLFGLARLISALYRRYRSELTLLLAGLILGSTRSLLPSDFSILFVFFALLGMVLVFMITNRQRILGSH